MQDEPEIFGRYLLLKSLGAGGAGDVHLARPIDRDSGIPVPVVIKRLHAQLEENEDFVRRFRHEARVAMHVSHPKLAKLYDCGSVGSTHYLTFEYVDGRPLSEILRELKNAHRWITVASALELMRDLLEALDALHTARESETGSPLGIVHRDVSPKNVMIDQSGSARLIDLGIGRSQLQDWRTRTGVVMGTLGYMSPEQVRGKPVDGRTDLFAAAVVLWELLALEPYVPRGSSGWMLKASLFPVYRPISLVRRDVPPELEKVLERALEVKPEERYSTGPEFLAALKEINVQGGEGEPLQKAVADLFGREMEESRTQITQLITITSPPAASQSYTQDAPALFASETGPAPRRSRMWMVEVTAVAIMLAIGLFVGRALLAPLQASLPPPVRVGSSTPLAEPQPFAEPKVAAPIQPEPPAIDERVDEERPAAAEVRDPKRRRKKAPGRTAGDPGVRTDRPALEPATAGIVGDEGSDGKRRGTALMNRAKQLRSKFAEGSEPAKQADKILGRLVLEMGAGDPARLDAIERELDLLAHKAAGADP